MEDRLRHVLFDLRLGSGRLRQPKRGELLCCSPLVDTTISLATDPRMLDRLPRRHADTSSHLTKAVRRWMHLSSHAYTARLRILAAAKTIHNSKD
jgi:hypothetical protein